MQCKDIPETPILQFLLKVKAGKAFATWYCGDFLPENSVVRAMPEGVSGKLAIAKMKAMIKKGLVDGCPCGCRGDFKITDRGISAVGQST